MLLLTVHNWLKFSVVRVVEHDVFQELVAAEVDSMRRASPKYHDGHAANRPQQALVPHHSQKSIANSPRGGRQRLHPGLERKIDLS